MSVNYFIKLHGKDFKYVGLDLFEETLENQNEVIPNTKNFRSVQQNILKHQQTNIKKIGLKLIMFFLMAECF